MNRQSIRRLLLGSACIAAAAHEAPAFAETAPTVDELIVTATARPEARSRIAGTVQVISPLTVERSTAESITDLLAENAVGFLNKWTPGQTQINIRGGASEGQGRDFRSQVLVLVNGRRAGTANVSKFSTADIQRVEIVRGPASVVYGSQNIGGVVNLITKNGRTAPGTAVQVSGGSWGLLQGNAQTGGRRGALDWFLSASAGRQDDYHSGDGGSKQRNTDWTRRGVTGALGWALDENNRLDLDLRTNGIYDAGFRGSGGNIYNREDRYNHSGDLTYNGKLLGGRVDLTANAYAVRDIDDFRYASPIQRGSNNLPAPGTSVDNNRRRIDIVGTRLQPRFTPWTGNQLLAGWDYEHSTVRSTRFRAAVAGQPALAQVSPQDNNQTDSVHALYFEDAQSLFSDRLTLRAGVRRTQGRLGFDFTPNLAGQVPRTVSYDTNTYSVGATYRVTGDLTWRVGASSGFRTPTATELAADFNALGGGRIFGNPNLKPETSHQIETGFNLGRPAWRLDVAVFQNLISDRIITRLRTTVANTSDYINNPADIEIEGLEFQYDGDVLKLLGREAGGWTWSVYSNGSYNFHMVDKGAAATANTRMPQRVYQYQAAFGTRFGADWRGHAWSVQTSAALSGPVWYDTEENLLVPQAEPFREYIHRKSPFWVSNIRGDFDVNSRLTLFAAVNNLFDTNAHPLFIAIDETPTKADLRFYNGSGGTSMPGREFQIGARARF